MEKSAAYKIKKYKKYNKQLAMTSQIYIIVLLVISCFLTSSLQRAFSAQLYILRQSLNRRRTFWRPEGAQFQLKPLSYVSVLGHIFENKFPLWMTHFKAVTEGNIQTFILGDLHLSYSFTPTWKETARIRFCQFSLASSFAPSCLYFGSLFFTQCYMPRKTQTVHFFGS